MNEKSRPPVPERRFVGTRADLVKKAGGKEHGSKKSPPLRPTGQLPKR